MGKALYRTHRSKKLSEVVGQEHITRTLENALKTGKISHAYLLTGPKGVGKTSVARILAHEVNGLPYEDERQHIDIIEIDAASNRRIDEIRELRDKARLSPLEARYKVYIIDEVHMLTREAFNALLKTLEEPPEHVIFILATTEAHKLPETIISRTQRYSFKPITTEAAIGHLKDIAKKEKIDLDDEAAQLIAKHGNGSFRDSISLLDQMGNTGSKVDAEAVRTNLGVPPHEVIEAIIRALYDYDAKQLIETLQSAQSNGYQATIIASHLSEAFRQRLLAGEYPVPQPLALLRALLAVPGSGEPYQELELILLEVILSVPPDKVVEKPAASQPTPVVSEPVKQAPKAVEKSAEPTPKPKVTGGKLDLAAALDDGLWERTLERMRGAHNTLYGVARMASVTTDGDVLVLGLAFDFHRRRLDDAKNQEKLQKILVEELGSGVEIRCEIDKDAAKEAPKAPAKAEQPAKSDTLGDITQVFGGGEVLED